MERERLQTLLARHAVWLLQHCRAAAADCPGYDAEDLMQDSLVVAIEYIAFGWFDRAPHVSIDAQTRTLLRLSVKRAKHNWIRAKARRGALERPVPEASEGGWERVVGRDFAVDPELFAPNTRDLVAVFRSLPSGLQRLALLAFHVPFAVKYDDLVLAARESRSPVRPAETAWEIFQVRLPEWPELADYCWRRLTAEIVRSTLEMGEISRTEQDRLLNAMESHASSGVQSLIAERAKRRVEGGE